MKTSPKNWLGHLQEEVVYQWFQQDLLMYMCYAMSSDR